MISSYISSKEASPAQGPLLNLPSDSDAIIKMWNNAKHQIINR